MHLSLKLNKTQVFPQRKMSRKLRGRHAKQEVCPHVITTIVWSSRKLCKSGKISTMQNEVERLGRFKEKPYCLLCVCVCAFQPSPTCSYCPNTYIQVISGKQKKQIIFNTSALLSFFTEFKDFFKFIFWQVIRYFNWIYFRRYTV